MAGKPWTVDQLFAGRPESRRLFDAVRRAIESIGPVEAIPHKTQVSFGGDGFRTNFAFVWLPQLWVKNRPDGSITLTFDLDRHVTHPRIAQSVELRPGRWVHHVVIEQESDLDETVRSWLGEAYAFGKVGLRGKKDRRKGADRDSERRFRAG